MGLPMYVSPSLAHRKLPTKQQQAPSLSEVIGASLFGPSQAAVRGPFTNRYYSPRGAALPEGHAANDVDYLLRTAESHLAERTVVDEIPSQMLHHAQQHHIQQHQQQQQQQHQTRPDVPPRHQTALDERRRRRSFPNNLVQPRIHRLQQLQQLHRTRESSPSSSSSTRRGLQAGHLLNLNRVQARASPTVAATTVATYATPALMPTSSHVQSIIAPGSVLLTTRREERQRRREERSHSDRANQGDTEGSMMARQPTNTVTTGTNVIDDITRRVQLYRHVAQQRRFRGVTRTNTATTTTSLQSSPSSPPPSLSSSTSSSLSSSPSSLGESNATNANGNVLNVTATPPTAAGSTTALSRTLDPIFLVPMSTNLGTIVLPTSSNSSDYHDYQRHYNLEPSSEGTYGLIAEPTYISLIQSQPPQTILSPTPRRYSPAYADALDVSALNRDVYGTSSESDSESIAVVAGTDSTLPPIDERGAASGECC